MESLFDIDERIMQLITLDESEIVDSETGEVLIDVFDELDKLSMQRNDKILGIARYIDALKRESELLKEKAEQLKERAKVKENKLERLKEYVKNSMITFDTKKIEDETVTVKLNSTKVVTVLDENQIPEEYLNTVVKVQPDRRKILADLKLGKIIPGAELGENKTITVR